MIASAAKVTPWLGQKVQMRKWDHIGAGPNFNAGTLEPALEYALVVSLASVNKATLTLPPTLSEKTRCVC